MADQNNGYQFKMSNIGTTANLATGSYYNTKKEEPAPAPVPEPVLTKKELKAKAKADKKAAKKKK
ncbi:MAG: hypothetical protein LBT20_04980 [Clostridiales bacterium]|jgi:hypothetical protein|nr:hypothetical protein [Clostridiales bacterium]